MSSRSLLLLALACALAVGWQAKALTQTDPNGDDFSVSFYRQIPWRSSVGELHGLYGTYKRATEAMQGLFKWNVNGRQVVYRVEIDWTDAKGNQRSLVFRRDAKKGIIKTGISEKFVGRLKEFEGTVPHFYLDKNGKVTVGWGHQVATVKDALALGLIRKDTLDKASETEVRKDWEEVNRQPKGKEAKVYDSVTKLCLSEDDMERLLTTDLERFEQAVRSNFPDYEDFPQSAKEALLDMAFNIGVPKLLSGFPNFVEAIKKKNWKAAGAESHRKDIQESRNKTVKQLFEQAAAESAD